MVTDDGVDLRQALAEWLLVRENGTSFSLLSSEIETEHRNGRVLLGIFDDRGFRMFRVESCDVGDEISMAVSAGPGSPRERLRLVPRTSAGDLSAAVEAARLQRAGEIAALAERALGPATIVRISLSAERGRLAHIILRKPDGGQFALASDVTETLSHEATLCSVLVWAERLAARRKQPIDEVWIAANKRRSREVRRALALLKPAAAKRFNVLELPAKTGGEAIVRSRLTLAELWRDKPRPIVLPANTPSELAGSILSLAPDETDVVHARHGETLRYNGLPFARVRSVMEKQRAWFGTAKRRAELNGGSLEELGRLAEELKTYRRADAANKRHELYRAMPEAWLESMLKRNIKALDANLILSPLYAQFRTSLDTIDLLALRKDGRLVVIEVKTVPDRQMVLQAADYWRKIELQRRKGVLERAGVFGSLAIAPRPAVLYAVAPALCFDRTFEGFARMLSPEIELWRFELHRNWREEIKVIARRNYSG
jgi:hypothetical protein